MANGFRYHPSARQVGRFERRNLWPQEEEERIPGSTFNEFLGSGSPINYEALGLPMDRRQREEEQFISSLWGDPADSDYDIQMVRREDLGLPPLEETPSLLPRTYLADTIDLDRLIRAESSGKKGQTSSQGAYGLAQFMPETYANWHKDSKITGVPIPEVFKGKKFEEVMDDEVLAKLAAKTYMRMLERYLERAEGLGPDDVTVRNILGSYNVGPTKYRSRVRKRRNFLRGAGRRDLEDVPFHLWERWLKVK